MDNSICKQTNYRLSDCDNCYKENPYGYGKNSGSTMFSVKEGCFGMKGVFALKSKECQ